MKILKILLVIGSLVSIVGCGGGGGSSSNSNTITHNGVTYKTVKSPVTNRVWLDRNIGAAEVCTTYNDVACYGDYFQWGRNPDGHEDSSSGVIATQATSISNVGNSLFIKAGSTYKYDWAYSVDSTGVARNAQWSKTDASSVCPSGFRVPTLAELSAEVNGHINNRVDAFNSFLKLPSAGYRGADSLFIYVGDIGAYWSVDINGNKSNAGSFTPNSAYGTAVNRAIGASVRCIKN